jgi:diguanylate cyclase (GGDEF)-like protein
VQALERELFIDSVTTLASRRAFSETVERIASGGALLGVLVFDLDRFHMIHHALGNHGAERVLRAVAQYLRAACPEARIIARLYGDEFAVAVHSHHPEAALRLAESVVDGVLRSPAIAAEERGLIRGLTAGASHTALSGRAADELLRDAMTALHEGKRAGGRCARLFSPEQREGAIHELRTEAALREGLARNELVPWFQPVFDLKRGCLVGFESLVRWMHPERGILRPADFLGIADRSGILGALGEQVARQSLAAGRRLQDQSLETLSLAINVSSRIAQHPIFLERFVRLVREAGFPPSRLVLEITEETFIDASPGLLQTLRALRRLGVKIALDDFGAGYSSLGALHDLPIDILKIDRAFVRRLSSHRPEDSIVATIVEIGRRLELTVLAEGVENEMQAAMLRHLGVTHAQGYWFGEARPESDVIDWLRSRIPNADCA